MKRKFICTIALFTVLVAVAQKPQRIGYIDMEYILENVPEYTVAKERLDVKLRDWQKKLDKQEREIQTLRTNLSNEKALLTDDLLAEREEDIKIKEVDLKNLQVAYFGTEGKLYSMRQQLVKPVQDQIYNAVQEIAKRKRYDMVLDKSSDLIMLYTNKKYDISEQVLNKIVKGRKVREAKKKREEKLETQEKKKEEVQQKAQEKASKNEQMKARIQQQQEMREKRRAEIKKQQEERRKKRQAEIEKRRKEREEKVKKAKENKDNKEENEENKKEN